VVEINSIMKLLVNEYEQLTDDRLVTACRADGARVCPKVRVKDALPIDSSGVSNEQYTFAFKSHFDFVVADRESNVLFAVEFDGDSHGTAEAKRRDELKNGLCRRFRLPLLRVKAKYLERKYRQWDLLSYFVDTWFLKRAFEAAYEKGMIPPDEDFDPMSVVSNGSGTRWPYWLSLPSQCEIKRLHDAGKITHFCPSHVVGTDSKDNYHCLVYIKVSADSWALVRTGMRSQLFDVCTADVIEQIGVIELRESLDGILAGRVTPHRYSEVEALFQDFQRTYKLRSSGGIAEPPLRMAAR
jgi:hypothetical protein